MPFCTKCGKEIRPDSVFCIYCGHKVALAAAPQQAQTQQARAQTQQAQPQQQFQAQPAAPGAAQGRPPIADEYDRRFARVTVRHRCQNGHVFNGTAGQTACPTCGAPLPKGGYIQIYRMGNYMGSLVGMGIYIDGVPYGHVGNRESVRVSVPYGTHELHMTHTSTRNSSRPKLIIAPDRPYAFCKAHFSKAGFSIGIEEAPPDSMPLQ